MKKQSIFRKFRKFLLGASLATAANWASAAYINFVEDQPVEESPFTVETNLLGANVAVGNDGVTFTGFSTSAISDVPLLENTTYVGGLFEAGMPGIVSDLIVLTTGPLGQVAQQDISVQVFSDDRPLSDVIAQYPFITASNFLIEDGTLQDISSVMGDSSQLPQDQGGTTLPFGLEGIRVSILSAIPKPASLVLLVTGLVAMQARRWQAAAA
jgi:hypothetical protein